MNVDRTRLAAIRTAPPPRAARTTALGLMVFALLIVVGCRAEREQSSGSVALPVPEGVATRSARAVPPAQRSDALQASREIVYRSKVGWSEDGPTTLHVATVGERVLVLSGVNGQIEEFSGGGEIGASWSEKGEREGQLFGPVGLAVRAGGVFVVDVAASRISRWTDAGEFVGEVSHDEISRINVVLGATESGLVVGKVLFTQDDEEQAVSLISDDGDELKRYAILPTDRNLGPGNVWPRPQAVVASDGAVHVSASATYQLLSFAPDGSMRLALEVDWPRAPVSDETRRTVERTQRAGRALGANVRDREGLPQVPDFLPALVGLEVDGYDRVYVFPLVEGRAERYPVDVYSPEGERLAASWLPFQSWDAQSGDHVYRIETDLASGETIVVRYRLELAG